MATCIHGVQLTADHDERCAWCRVERERWQRVDDINRLRELIVLYGRLRRDVGAFGGDSSQNGRAALRKASKEASEVYETIEQILHRLREASRPPVPPRATPENPPGPSLNDPGQQENYACATCGAFVEYVPAKYSGDPEQGWRHKGLPPRDVRAHVVRPQSLG